MFALQSQRLRRRLSAPTSGSARRRLRERKKAEQTRAEGERLARERREQKIREKLEQQRQALKELASYEPWGKAGGGAPNAQGVRYSDLRATGIYPEDELKGVSKQEARRRWPSPRRRRCTSLRLREDPQIYHAEQLRQAVDNDIRYRQTPTQQQDYKHILDDMVDRKKKIIEEEKRRSIEYEHKMQTMDEPWGKPGPGGTTWRNPRNIGLNFSKSMGWTDNDVFNKIKGDHKRHKRSSLTLPQVKRDDGSKADESPNKENEKPSSVDKLPEIIHTNNSEETSPEANGKNIVADKNDNGIVAKEITNNNGKHKRGSKKNKFVKRLSNGDRVRRVIPEVTISKGVKNEDFVEKLTPEAAILRLTGGIELVPLLARRRRVGTRTLPSSDVTRPPVQACEWREIFNVEYLTELKQQMRMKYEKKEESRRDSAENVRRHHETWDSLWGRPGHGAPQRGRYTRNNLAHLLYVVPISNAN